MASDELLRRENAELRAREERYREGLQRQLDLSKRLRQYAAHLRASLRDQPLRAPEEVFAEVAQVSAGALGIGRVSVWLFDRARGVLRCHHLFVHGHPRPIAPEISLGQIQSYVRALTTDLVAVEDVATDPRVLELRRYCTDHQIGALLDVPIVIDGEVLGVICHEHLGGPRRWHDAEIDFAANLGSVVALAIEAERRFEAERRYRQLIDHVDLIGVVLDARGAIAAVNEAFAHAVGVARAEAVGADFVERFVPEAERARVRGLFAEGIRTHALPARFESSLRAQGGELRSVVWTNTLLFDGAGGITGIASLGLDLTERLRLEAELAQQRKFESLGRMAASVAHDFNNVLTVISLSLARGGRSGEIAAAMSYARDLVSSLMSYARRDPVAAADVDVDEAIHELEPVLATAIGKDLQLEVERHAAGRHVRIAPIELRQLVVNMITNAGEATRGHGGTVRLTTSVVAHEAPPGTSVEIRIADDGRGMDAETLARAFDPFFTTKPAGEGTGIGLATCQSIVSRAGGTITVDSNPGRGTTFRIALPAVAGEDAAATGEEAAADAAGTAGGEPAAPRLLLVEDSPTLGDLISFMLRDSGYEVILAKTVAEARAALAGAPFDVVITDLRMPDGRGEDIVAAARERGDRTAIVVASGEATVINGVDGVVMKPFTPDELRQEIARAVAHRREAGRAS